MDDIDLKIPEYAGTALEVLGKNGFEGFCVGGCVRDALLGKAPYDFDIATNALPQQTARCFSAYHTFDNGIKHGTLSVIIDSHCVEITTFRSDGVYSDNRHPDSVKFSQKLEQDLSRRDFTVNAMAFSPKGGLCDPFGGEKDIENRLIRCVGNADKRFGEDSLRILRALRFSSVLNFGIERNTAESICRNMPLVKNVSAERIYTELVKLINGKNAASVICSYPCLTSVLFGFTLSTRQKRALRKSTDALEKAAIIFLRGNDAEKLKFYKPDNKRYRAIIKLINIYRLRLSRRSQNETELKKILFKNDIQPQELISALRIRKNIGSALDANGFIELLEKIESEKQCYSIKGLEIDGEKLKNAGLAGEEISEMQRKLVMNVICGKVKNEYKSLSDFVMTERNTHF